MKVGIDARVLMHQPTGVARYLAGILRELPHLRSAEDRLVFYVDSEPPETLPGNPDRVVVLPWRLGGDPAWRQLRLGWALRRDPVDVLFCPFYSIPLGIRLPSVVAIHDVAFEAHPEWFDWKGRLAFRLVRPSSRRASSIVTGSEFSAAEIAHRLGVSRGKIQITPYGVDPTWFEAPPPDADRALQRWLAFDDPYVLHLGAVHERRRPDLLLAGFARLPGRFADHKLVVAGPTIAPVGNFEELAAKAGIRGRVIRREWVPEELVRALVWRARAVVYLSVYEGFGLPALEAMAAGTALVVLRRASLPEICGDTVVWVEKEAPELVGEALASALAHPSASDQHRQERRDRARRFSWATTARLTWGALRAAARAPGA